MLNHLSIATVSGANALSFLQGYITCDLDAIREDCAQVMAITDLRGRVVANGWVFGNPEQLKLVIHASVQSNLHEHLAPYLRFARCTFEESALPMFVTESLRKEIVSLQLNQEFFGLTTDAATSLDLDAFQIDSGHPLVTNQTSSMFLPQMLNLTRFGAVSFQKGCYLGQEVVARAEHRGRVKRTLRKAVCVGNKVKIGDQTKTQQGVTATVVSRYGDSALVVTSSSSDDQPVRLAESQLT
ncbi:MAG: hypothetical protein F4W90_12345 [Gammaproteobacteria bacterium]|nr:hypothetical protein [Gammaproteobacteria bacterium]